MRRGVWVLLASLLASPAQAGIGDNLFGARVVDQLQFTLQVGYPDVQVGLRVPVSRDVELTPRARFAWARGTFVGALEGSLGVDLRAQLLDQGRMTLAVVGSLPVHLAALDNGELGVGIGLLWPGFMLTWEIEGVVDLDLGVQVQDDLYILPGGNVGFHGRVPLIAGFEVELATGLQLGLLVEGGPGFGTVIQGPASVGAVRPHLRVVAGFGYSF